MKTIKIYAGLFRISKFVLLYFLVDWFSNSKLEAKCREDGEIRKQSVAIKKKEKGKLRREISPLVSNVRRILLFRAFISPRCAARRRKRRKENEEISSTFPGSFASAHASFVDFTFLFH